MRRKAVSGILLMLLLTSMLTLAFNVQSVKAELTGTVYIGPDGSIHPSTAPIQRDGNVYTFTGDIYGCIVVARSNIVIDGAGYTLQGDGGGKGFEVFGVKEVTIKNINIKRFSYGIYINYSPNNTIFGNNITANDFGIIKYYYSENTTISSNNITANNYGILLWSGSNNTIFGNNIKANNHTGIYLGHSHNNTIFGNNITANDFGIGIYYYSSNNKIYHNNFVDNTQQVYIGIYGGANVWDDGYPSGGNYWSDYTERYPDAKEIDGSGIWDTPYVIDENNVDRYPLMKPWTPTPENQPPNPPTNLGQFKTDGSVLDVGATTDETTVMFKGKVSDPDGDRVKLQVELRRLDEYSGQFNEAAGGFKESEFVQSGSTATAYAYGLVDGSYHWRARTVDEYGLASNWVDFGNNDISEADFTVSTPDTIPPAAVTDLDISIAFTYSVILKWTAPGDDGNLGTASEYDLRYSTSAITEVNWDSAIRVTDVELARTRPPWPKPQPAGCLEVIGVKGLSPGTTYYFALKTADEVPNWSPLSNVLEVETLPNHPPKADFTWSPEEPKSGQLVTFDASASYDPDLGDDIVYWRWEYGELTALGFHSYGIIAEGEDKSIISYRFRGSTEGSKDYVVKLTITDRGGATSWAAAGFTVSSLEKTIPITGAPWVTMIATYNWINEINGEDIYMVSKISTDCGGLIGTVKPSIWSEQDKTTIWHDTQFQFGGGEVVYSYAQAFEPGEFGASFSMTKVVFPDGTFEGIEVHASDEMHLVVDGLTLGPEPGSLPSKVYYALKTTFDPDSPVSPLWYLAEVQDLIAHLCSSGELRVYDDRGRITGLVNGEVRQEIPNSVYFNNTVIICPSNDSYRYEVAGTEDGLYGLIVASFIQGESNTFTATDIPILTNAIHQYTVNWDALSLGEEGVTIEVDSDGDGVFEHTFTSDDELSRNEYVAAINAINTWITDSDFNEIESFRAVFTPYGGTELYKLTATNPGQFYFNILVNNTWSETINLTIIYSLDANFVLKGARPIHVYLDMNRTIDITANCTFSDNTITIYNVAPNTIVYVTIHLDYALKGTTWTEEEVEAWYSEHSFNATVCSIISKVVITDPELQIPSIPLSLIFLMNVLPVMILCLVLFMAPLKYVLLLMNGQKRRSS